MRRLWSAIAGRPPAEASPEDARHGPAAPPSDASARRTVVSSDPRVCAISDVGRVREHNEDVFYVSPGAGWFVVADGMGGHDAGEVAAAMAVQAIVERLTVSAETSGASPGAPTSAAAGDCGARLLDAVAAAHHLVHEANRGRDAERPMGCTIAVCSIASELLVCHVGDVRCYLARGGTLHQITKDHSTVATLVEAGHLTPEQARVHANKNEVLQAIGMPVGVRPDITPSDIAPGDRILLCSDGLWEALPHEELESIVTSDGTVRQIATQLVDRANSAGGHDNITAVLYEVGAEAATGAGEVTATETQTDVRNTLETPSSRSDSEEAVAGSDVAEAIARRSDATKAES